LAGTRAAAAALDGVVALDEEEEEAEAVEAVGAAGLVAKRVLRRGGGMLSVSQPDKDRKRKKRQKLIKEASSSCRP
jgi:malonyl CoA-acyl carrier protein transacylase